MPLLLKLFPVRRWWIPFAAVVAGSMAFRAGFDTYMLNEFHTLSCMGDLAVGGAGAWMCRSERARGFFARMPRWQIAAIYAVVAVFFFFRGGITSGGHWARVFERPVMAFAFLGVIMEQNFARRSFYKMSRFRLASRLGLVSYGLYLTHFIGILITLTSMRLLGVPDNLFHTLGTATAVSLAVTVAISLLCYRFVETPFLRLKDRFGYLRAAGR